MAPTLQRLAEGPGSLLRVAKIDADANRELAKRLGVTGLPTLILFKRGKEVSRQTAAMSSIELRAWLGCNGVRPPGNDDASPSARPVSWGAFYGDAGLRDYLFGRLHELALTGGVVMRRFPYWTGESGSASAAMVRSDDPRVFERITGLPYSFGCAIEFAGFHKPQDIERLRAAIKPGADLSLVALKLMHAWLSNPGNNWSKLLDDEAVGALRMRWIELSSQFLDGQPQDPSAWPDLRTALSEYPSKDRNVDHSIQDDFRHMLISVSPPPEPESVDAWVTALMLGGIGFRGRLRRTGLGWTRDEMREDDRFILWLRSRAKLEPGGMFTPDRQEEALAEWKANQALPGYEQKLAAELATREADWDAQSEPLRERLIWLVEAASS